MIRHNSPLDLFSHFILKSIVATIYAQLFGTILLYSDCVIPGGNRVPGTSYAPTSIEPVQVLYQPLTRPYKVIEFVSVDRAIAEKDRVIERKLRAVAATKGANAVNISELKILRYLRQIFREVRAMKGAEKEAGFLRTFQSLRAFAYFWSRVARNPWVLKLFARAIVWDALLIGAVCAVHLLISLIRKRRTRVFISFQHEREPIADTLASEMTKYGIRAEKLPFKENPDHDTLVYQMSRGIRDCDVFVCVPGKRPSFVDYEVGVALGAKKPMLFVLIEADAPHLPNAAMKGYPVFALERLQRFQRKGFRILASFCSYLAADWRSTVRVYGAVFNHLFASTGIVFAVFLTSTVILTCVTDSVRGPGVAVPPVGFLPASLSDPVFLACFVSPLILFLIFYGLFFITRWVKRAQIRNMTCGQKFRDSFIPKTLGYSLTRAHLRKILYRGDIVAHHESPQS
jgi:TIR domain